MNKRVLTTGAMVWLTLTGMLVVVSAAPAQAAATATLADWQMDESPGATVMVDTSGNGIDGTIGSAIVTGVLETGVSGYHWVSTAPNQPPPKPERLVQVPDSRLNPGTGDYAVTVRFRTTRTFGNVIQKGQAGTPGGYFKWQIPNGELSCLFRGRDPNGNILSKSVNSGSTPLNDGLWHTVRCERTATGLTMTVDGTLTRKAIGPTGDISNTVPLTIAGKLNCDQISITCDYFVGDIDFVKIETAPAAPPDVAPPTTPGTPTGVSNTYTSIDLTWSGSTDTVSSSLTYRVYRDGTLIGSTTTAASTVSFTDQGLVPESVHAYSIVAVDGAQNPSDMSPPSESITVQAVPAVIFSDDFSSGLSNWTTVTRMTLDGTTGDAAAPSARAQVTQLSAFATKVLPISFPSLCVSTNVNETQFTTNVLLRLRTSADGPIARVSLDSAGSLRFRSDVSGLQSPATVALGTDWHTVELCGTVGTATTWDLYRDGVKVLNQWVANTGTISIGRVGIGDTTAKTWTANFDDVVIDHAPG